MVHLFVEITKELVMASHQRGGNNKEGYLERTELKERYCKPNLASCFSTSPKFLYWIPVMPIFFAAIIAEYKRAPFDLPEAESELVGGYFTEFRMIKCFLFC